MAPRDPISRDDIQPEEIPYHLIEDIEMEINGIMIGPTTMITIATMMLLSAIIMILLLSLGVTISSYYSESTKVVYRLPKRIIPTHYKVQLLINTDDYHGDVIITINILKETKKISFHSFRLDINYNKIKLINKKYDVSLELVEYIYHNQSQVNTIFFPNTLLPGRYILHIKFTGIITDDNKDGFVGIRYTRNEQKNNPEVYVANSQVMGARRIFPCWDEPEFKTTFSITVRHPRNTLAISATSVKRNVVGKDGDWTFFRITPVMSTYLIALMIYDRHNFVSTFPSTTQLTRNVYIWGRKPMTNLQQLSFANNIITRIADGLDPMQWYLNKDAIKHEGTTSNHINTLRQHNQITSKSIMHRVFRARDILYDEKVDPVVRKTEIAHLIGHKLAHLWVGNVVAPAWWSSSWVNEGFSTLFALKMLEKKFPEMRLMDLFVVQAKHECLRMDTQSILHPLNNERVNKLSDINSFSIEYYIKAPIILRMLEHALTSEVFWLGYHIYLYEYHYQSATPRDLWNAMQLAMQNDLEFEHSVIEAMNVWINNNSYPIINVRRDYRIGMMLLEIDKHTLQVEWIVPVNYISLTMLNSAIWNNLSTLMPMKQTTTWLTLNRVAVRHGINKDDWVLINIQQSGYYRVYYDEENWQRLARYLQTADYDKINVLNRAQIIDDAYHFMKEGKLKLEIFFNLTEYLGLLEKDYIAWYPMIKALEDSSRYIPYPRDRFMKSHMVKLLLQLLNRIGYVVEKEDEHDFTKQLRQEAIRWACAFNGRMCKKMAEVELKRYIANPLAYKSRADYKEWIFCKGLILADTDTWNKLFVMWTSKPDNNTLKYFACSEDPEIIYKYLRPVSSEYAFAVIAHHHTNSFLSIVARHARKTNILKFILKNFEKIKPRQISTVAALTVIINYVYSDEQLKMVEKVAKNIAKENLWDIQVKIHNRLSQINDHQIH